MNSSHLSPVLEMFARIFDGQSPQVRELFQYALVMLSVEDGRAEVIERHTIDLREHLTFKTVTGDLFTIVKPDVSAELLAHVTALVREVLQEDSGEPDA
jgi:hypothetical protein